MQAITAQHPFHALPGAAAMAALDALFLTSAAHFGDWLLPDRASEEAGDPAPGAGPEGTPLRSETRRRRALVKNSSAGSWRLPIWVGMLDLSLCAAVGELWVLMRILLTRARTCWHNLVRLVQVYFQQAPFPSGKAPPPANWPGRD